MTVGAGCWVWRTRTPGCRLHDCKAAAAAAAVAAAAAAGADAAKNQTRATLPAFSLMQTAVLAANSTSR
jgi:hypothetical protein